MTLSCGPISICLWVETLSGKRAPIPLALRAGGDDDLLLGRQTLDAAS